MKNLKTKEKHWESKAQEMTIIDIEDYYDSYFGHSIINSFKGFLPDDLRGKKFLDVGCGTGYYFKYFQDRGVKELVGVDVGMNLLKITRHLNPFVKTISAKGENLPFPDNYFDIIISLGLIEHFLDPKPILQEMVRVLNVKGTIIICTPNLLNPIFTIVKLLHRNKWPWEHWWTPQDLINQIKGISSLKFKKYTSSVIFCWCTRRIIDNKMTRFLNFHRLVANIEHTKFLKYFGHLMFVSAEKLDLK